MAASTERLLPVRTSIRLAAAERSERRTPLMRYLIPALALSLIAVQPAPAQQVAPGWFSTGEWQCGPYVRIITSTDGRDGMDFLVIGAWFDNHYTLRRGQLYYNGIPCTLFGTPPWGPPIKLDERIDK
jgi:hypothetical protein